MDQEYFKAQLEYFQKEHKRLNDEIQSLINLGTIDDLYIHKLKKKKLIMKDQISIIESKLVTDIIA